MKSIEHMRYDPENPFDRLVRRISHHPRFRNFAFTYIQYKEFILYALMGIGTVFISIGLYSVFTELLHWDVLLANAVAWIFATLFAFLSNRQWVFTTHRTGRIAFIEQLCSFSFGRFLTLLLEEGLLYGLVEVAKWPNIPVKLGAQVIVIAANYLISKLFVFSTGRGRMHHLLEQRARAIALRIREEEARLKRKLEYDEAERLRREVVRSEGRHRRKDQRAAKR